MGGQRLPLDGQRRGHRGGGAPQHGACPQAEGAARCWTHPHTNRARSAVEHVFAAQKAGMGLFIRTIDLGRATVKIGIANLAHNFRRLIWLEGRIAPV
ncbi:hypothetical protein FHW79_006416 [Azospirillum sp. OGB3]|uniref:hypothetical protein n=1 Tax=Azospirillum sp. OGB3 TaxID=2587012 RepID=UPI001605926B|nr:hypothetical protein [Azospirillum sp. OGB3]MBB3268741.1 hypothetical protein [Azospirillum sp. OGB3]